MHVTPIGWAYIIGAIVLWRVLSGAAYRADPSNGPLGAVMLGAFGAMMWPLVVTVWALYQACVRWPDLMMRIFLHEPSRDRKERKLNRRREQIARLEEELGIDG